MSGLSYDELNLLCESKARHAVSEARAVCAQLQQKTAVGITSPHKPITAWSVNLGC